MGFHAYPQPEWASGGATATLTLDPAGARARGAAATLILNLIAGLPFYLQSGPEAPGCMLSVSPIQRGGDARFQAFCFTSVVGQRLEVPGLPFQSKCNLERESGSRLRVRGLIVSPIQQFEFQLSSVPVDARQKSVQHPVSLSDERKHADSILQWARGLKGSRVNGFDGPRGYSVRFYCEPEAPGCRLSVSPIQWAGDSRFRSFRFTFERARRSRFQAYRFSQSAILQWARLQAPDPRPRLSTYTVVRVAAQQRAGGCETKERTASGLAFR